MQSVPGVCDRGNTQNELAQLAAIICAIPSTIQVQAGQRMD